MARPPTPTSWALLFSAGPRSWLAVMLLPLLLLLLLSFHLYSCGESTIHARDTRMAFAQILLKPQLLPPTARPTKIRIGEAAGTDDAMRCRRVVSTSLFSLQDSGHVDALYAVGLLQSAILLQQSLPGWCLRIYIGANVAENSPILITAVQRIPAVHCVILPFAPTQWEMGRFWRFLVADDDTVDLFIVRDSDSRIEARDVAGIRAFVASGRPFYCIHDNQWHEWPVLAGMWGARRGELKRLLGQPMWQLATAWAADHMPLNRKVMDQAFLQEAVWPLVKAHALNLVLPAQYPRLCFGAVECVAAAPPLYPPPSPVPGPFPEDFVGRICAPEESYVCHTLGSMVAGIDRTQGLGPKAQQAMDAAAAFVICKARRGSGLAACVSKRDGQ